VLDDGTIVSLSGRLDVHVAADVRLALAAAVDRGAGELVVDLTDLESVDATGLGVLVGAHRRAQRAGRTLVLTDVPASVGRLLLVTRLDRVLRTRRTERCA
jgi:anti-anti-sigma factor